MFDVWLIWSFYGFSPSPLLVSKNDIYLRENGMSCMENLYDILANNLDFS
jgi:hypothetical protein